MASIEVKQISSSCKTRMSTPVSVYEKYGNQWLRIYTYRARRFECMYDTEVSCAWASNNQLTIVCVFLYTETCSFRGSWTRTHERFRWSKWRTRYSLPFSCACFRVVKASRMLVSAPATGHHGQHYDCSRSHASLLRDACMLIMIQKR